MFIGVRRPILIGQRRQPGLKNRQIVSDPRPLTPRTIRRPEAPLLSAGDLTGCEQIPAWRVVLKMSKRVRHFQLTQQASPPTCRTHV